MGEVLTTHVATGENIADLATKVVTNGPKMRLFGRETTL